MAKKKISDLPAGSALTGIELVPIVQSGTTKRITAQDIADLSNASSIGGGGTANYVSKFTTEFNIGDSQIFDNGTSVGIATDTPNALYKLDVNGDLQASSIVKSGGTSAEYLKADGSVSTLTNPITGTGTTNYLPKFTGSTALGNSIFSEGAGIGYIEGNLQIQNANPSLTISRISGNYPTINFNIGSTNYGSIISNASNGEQRYSIGPSAGWGGYHTFFTDTTERMRITSGGNILIGTTTDAGYKLNVNGTARVSEMITIGSYDGLGLKMQSATSTGNTYLRFYNSAGTARGYFGLFWNGSSDYMLYDSGTLKMSFESGNLFTFNGSNVLIGTTTDAGYKLDVNGTARVFGTSAGLTIQSTSAGQNAEIFFTSTATTWRIGQNIGTATDFEIYNGSTKFKMNTTGVVTLNNGTTNQNTRIFDNKIGMSRTSDGAEVVYFSKNTDLGAEGTANINGYDGIQFRTQGAESVKAVITSAGNVGIGTTAPTAKLDIKDSNKVFDGYGNVNIFTSDSFAENIGGSIAFGGASNGGTTPYPFAKIQGYKEGSGSWSGSLIFGTTQSNSAITEKMRITSAGNVLIGTTTDSGHKLNVNGVIKNNDDIITTNGTISTILAYSTTYGGVFGTSSNHNANIYTNGTPKFTITAGGNVGIGTTNPSQKLHLYTASASSIYTRIENANGNTYLGLSAGGDTILSADTAGNNLLLYTAATERMRILSNGQLAVNTTSPDASALVQIDSTTQGFLVPRMLESEINAISSPAEGLMVYNTDQKHMCMYDGSGWKKFSMSNM